MAGNMGRRQRERAWQEMDSRLQDAFAESVRPRLSALQQSVGDTEDFVLEKVSRHYVNGELVGCTISFSNRPQGTLVRKQRQETGEGTDDRMSLFGDSDDAPTSRPGSSTEEQDKNDCGTADSGAVSSPSAVDAASTSPSSCELEYDPPGKPSEVVNTDVGVLPQPAVQPEEQNSGSGVVSTDTEGSGWTIPDKQLQTVQVQGKQQLNQTEPARAQVESGITDQDKAKSQPNPKPMNTIAILAPTTCEQDPSLPGASHHSTQNIMLPPQRPNSLTLMPSVMQAPVAYPGGLIAAPQCTPQYQPLQPAVPLACTYLPGDWVEFVYTVYQTDKMQLQQGLPDVGRKPYMAIAINSGEFLHCVFSDEWKSWRPNNATISKILDFQLQTSNAGRLSPTALCTSLDKLLEGCSEHSRKAFGHYKYPCLHHSSLDEVRDFPKAHIPRGAQDSHSFVEKFCWPQLPCFSYEARPHHLMPRIVGTDLNPLRYAM